MLFYVLSLKQGLRYKILLGNINNKLKNSVYEKKPLINLQYHVYIMRKTLCIISNTKSHLKFLTYFIKIIPIKDQSLNS